MISLFSIPFLKLQAFFSGSISKHTKVHEYTMILFKYWTVGKPTVIS